MEGSTSVAVVMAGIAVLSLVLHLAVFIKSGAWTMSDRLVQMEARLLNEITDQQEKLQATSDELRRAFDGKLDDHEHRFGETARAMQQKIHEIETWSRDQFVRKNEFEQFATRLESTMLRADAKIDKIQSAVTQLALAAAAK